MNRPAYPRGRSGGHGRPRNALGSSPTVALLLAGACAGPLLVTSSLLQGVLRQGFDFRRHPPSALALGSAGAVQQVTFASAGLLLVAGAMGLRHLDVGRWAPRSVMLLGGALAAAGLFSMDPAFGFPPGAPPGVGDAISWHAAIHGVLFPIGFLGLVATAVLMGRRYGRAGRRSMRSIAHIAAVASLGLSLWPNLGGDPEGRFLPMWAGIVIGYAWMSMLFVDLRREALAARDGRAEVRRA
jgi:Protein of unknown function (DUF998)